jgi:hypothetical protein
MTKKVALKVKCPLCDTSLMDENHPLTGYPSIKLNVVTSHDRGTIRLCSVYGCYEHESDIEIKDGEIANFFCPHCNKDLKSNDECDSPDCNAPMIPLNIVLGGKVFICSRKGCTMHFVAFEDLDTQIRKFYHEYGF